MQISLLLPCPNKLWHCLLAAILTVCYSSAHHSSCQHVVPLTFHELTNVPPGASDRVDIYYGLTGAWTTAVLSLARSFLSAATLPAQGLLLFAGGRTSTGASSRVDIFNGVTGSWTTDELSAAREGLVGTCLPDQKLAIFAGGATDSGDGLLYDRIFCAMQLPSCLLLHRYR